MTFRCSWSMADPAGCDNDAVAWVDGLAVCGVHTAKSVAESINIEAATGVVAHAAGGWVGIRGGGRMLPRLAAIAYGVGFDPIEEGGGS